MHKVMDGSLPLMDAQYSVGQAIKLLNYLLQAAEGVTCKAALMWAWDKIKEEKLRAEPRLFYHDEMAFQSHPDDAKRVGEILNRIIYCWSRTLRSNLYGWW